MDWEQEAAPESVLPREPAGLLSSISSASPQSPKKRKFSSESGEGGGVKNIPNAVEGKAVQDRSHSVVEKRYRENLNQKIADLGDCIPNLRADGGRLQSGGSASQKRNKATVLTEAMAYIEHLEKRNAYLEEVNLAMKDQMQRQERNGEVEVRESDEERLEVQEEFTEESSTTTEEGNSQNEPRGMIPVPEEMRRLWRNQCQEHYADGMRDSGETSTGSVHIKGGKFIGRMAVGSLAGFMILDGFATPRAKHEKREDRGLSAIPLPYLFPNLRRVIAHYHGTTLLPSSFLLPYFSKAFLVFCALGLTLFFYLYYSRPPPRKSRTPSIPQPAPSLASPLEVRQNAWLTSIQTVWVPRHHILPEMIALILETAAYLTRKLLGWRCYLWVTGRTEEEEVANIRAWDIALDAQLSGGDPEVSKGRLVLTLWAAGTLPSTPTRLMLKALHIRVLFWQPSHFDSVSRVMHRIAFLLARHQWEKASKVQDSLKKTSNHAGLGQSDPLPDHLNALLEKSPDEVLNDSVIQRSHNFVWNRQSDDSTQDDIDGVVDDSAMQGPLDLIASWFSSSKLQAGLLKSLESIEGPDFIGSDIDLAVRTASPRSITSACALVAKGVFLDADNRCFSHLKWALPPSFPEDHTPPPSTSPVEIQILIAARCRFGLSLMSCNQVGATAQVSSALRLISQRPTDVGLLGSAATSYVLSLIFKHSEIGDEQLFNLRKDVKEALVRLEQVKTPTNAVEATARNSLCEALRRSFHFESSQRRTSNASLDAGYGTMSDDEGI